MSNTIQRESAGTVQAGVKTGGRFRKQNRSAASAPTIDRAAEDDYRQVYRLANKMAGHMVQVGDREEIVQEAVVSIYTSSASKGRTNIAAEHRGLIAPSVRGIISQHANAQEHHTSHSGRVELARARADLESTLERSLTRREVEALAEQVRLSFAPGRRPKIGYHEGPTRPTSLNALEEAEGEDGNTFSTPYAVTHDVYPVEEEQASGDSLAFARANEELERGEATRRDIKSRFWEILNEANPAVPKIQPVSRKEAHQLRKTFPDASDADLDDARTAHHAASDWLNGSCDPREEAALFAPFGGLDSLSISQQEAVAERIGNDPGRGHNLWLAAISIESP